jgi:hypothetical protein
MPSAMQVMVRLLLLGCIAVILNAELIQYHNHEMLPLQPQYLTIPKYTSHDVPSWPPGHGRSYIDLAGVKMRANCLDGHPKVIEEGPTDYSKCSNSTLQILMFEEPTEKPWMDYWRDSAFCCTQSVIEKGHCNLEGRMIVPMDLPAALLRTIEVPYKEVITLSDKEGSNFHHDIARSGNIIVLMAICNENDPNILLDGSVDSIDPYGYLPADMFGNLPFYAILSIAYDLVGVGWLIACAIHTAELMPLQLWITAVLTLGMLETNMLFYHYLNWNDAGTPAYAITFMGLLFGVSKRALSRVVVQFVALGYGVVRPSLGDDIYKVLGLGGFYFILSLLYTLFANSASGSEYTDSSLYDSVSYIIFILAGIDTTFYGWIITSINNLLVTLAVRKQAVKYVLYRNFRTILFVSLFFACVWAFYGSMITMSSGNGTESNWQYYWTIDALWEVTYFVLFVSIAILWAPSKNNQRYAYSLVAGSGDDGDDNDVPGKSSSLEAEMTQLADESLPEEVIDAEYGGQLHDESDPFQGP